MHILLCRLLLYSILRICAKLLSYSFTTPEEVYSMDIGKEADRTDGTQRYIILYDSDENEIKVGGYELEGGDNFDRYFHLLYQMLEDDYTKQWSDKLDECMRDNTTYGERYLNW